MNHPRWNARLLLRDPWIPDSLFRGWPDCRIHPFLILFQTAPAHIPESVFLIPLLAGDSFRCLDLLCFEVNSDASFRCESSRFLSHPLSPPVSFSLDANVHEPSPRRLLALN